MKLIIPEDDVAELLSKRNIKMAVRLKNAQVIFDGKQDL